MKIIRTTVISAMLAVCAMVSGTANAGTLLLPTDGDFNLTDLLTPIASYIFPGATLPSMTVSITDQTGSVSILSAGNDAVSVTPSALGSVFTSTASGQSAMFPTSAFYVHLTVAPSALPGFDGNLVLGAYAPVSHVGTLFLPSDSALGMISGIPIYGTLSNVPLGLAADVVPAPVPAPATVWLFLLGSALLGWRVRSSRRA